MDNITHSLVGLTVAEGIYQCYEKKTLDENRHLHIGLWLVSFISNNFPDLDYLYVILLKLKRLGGLLHHRGHTHTLLLGIPEGLLIGALFLAVAYWRKWKLNPIQMALILVTGVLGIWTHIFLDSLNSYGVHPFWPFNKSWYYADTLFIVEPFFWLAFTPLLFFAARHVLLRSVFSTLFCAIIVLCWVSGTVLPEISLVVTLAGMVLVTIAVRTSKKRYVHGSAWFFCFLFLAVFQTVSQHAKGIVRRTLLSYSPGAVIHDVILSPMPGNPFCWGTLVVDSLGPVTTYKVRRAITTPFPQVINLERCLKVDLAKPYLEHGKFQSDEDRVHWFGSEEFPIKRFRELAQSHCGFAGYLRFARAPAFIEKEDKLIVRDMRYDIRNPNFTSIEFPLEMPMDPTTASDCSLGVDWEIPRKDLLGY